MVQRIAAVVIAFVLVVLSAGPVYRLVRVLGVCDGSAGVCGQVVPEAVVVLVAYAVADLLLVVGAVLLLRREPRGARFATGGAVITVLVHLASFLSTWLPVVGGDRVAAVAAVVLGVVAVVLTIY
ncbi:hypothetical protein [Actinokineospora pegani]|uniref:hypothetical protein n=1 Tax=Actinokineospora pegani TaxID=2654637 RepID=UPI0012E992E8|nr:hypothetical protein [Actinokineospora pegani]